MSIPVSVRIPFLLAYNPSNTENIGFDIFFFNKTRANKKNKLENQNQGKNKKHTKKNNTPARETNKKSKKTKNNKN